MLIAGCLQRDVGYRFDLVFSANGPMHDNPSFEPTVEDDGYTVPNGDARDGKSSLFISFLFVGLIFQRDPLSC